MAGFANKVRRVMERIVWTAGAVRTVILEDSSVGYRIEDLSGEEMPGEDIPMFGIAGVSSRPADKSDDRDSPDFGEALVARIQLDDSVLIIASHDARYAVQAAKGEFLIHALGKTGTRQSTVRLKPDGTIEIDGDNVVIGNPGGNQTPIPLGSLITAWLEFVFTVVPGANPTGGGAAAYQAALKTALNAAGFNASSDGVSSRHTVED